MTPTAMDELVDLLVEDERWQKVGLPDLAEKACPATLKHIGLDASRFEISLLACDDSRIATLNHSFRGKETPTNVLSWPSAERGAEKPGQTPDLPRADAAGMALELGNIAIAYETCAREATQSGHDMAAHVTHLLVHGTLHLLGYDHIFVQDAALMEGLETEILASLGYTNPYRDD